MTRVSQTGRQEVVDRLDGLIPSRRRRLDRESIEDRNATATAIARAGPLKVTNPSYPGKRLDPLRGLLVVQSHTR